MHAAIDLLSGDTSGHRRVVPREFARQRTSGRPYLNTGLRNGRHRSGRHPANVQSSAREETSACETHGRRSDLIQMATGTWGDPFQQPDGTNKTLEVIFI